MKENNVLDSFDLLRKGKKEAQIYSVLNIINHFNTKLQEAGGGECKELELGVRRVVRGLGASKSSVRKGFYILLSGIIESFPSVVTFESLCNAINKELVVSPGIKADSDSFKGQVLAYGALIHTGKVFEGEPTEILRNLGSLYRKKSYLKAAAHGFIVEFLQKIDESTFKGLWDVIKLEYLVQVPKRTYHFYHLLLVLKERFPNIVDEDQLIILMGSPDVIHANSIKQLTQQLLELPNISCVDSSFYKEVLYKLISKKKMLRAFWDSYDTTLSSPTTFRLNLGLKLFPHICNKIKDKNSIKDLLTPNFVMVFETPQEVEAIETERKSAITEFVKILSGEGFDKEVLVEIFEKLYFFPGSFQFFTGPGRAVYHALLSRLDEGSIKTIAKLLIKVITDKTKKVISMDNEEPVLKPWKETQKKRAYNNLSKLITHSATNNSIEWKVNCLKLIMENAFFNRTITPHLNEAAKKCFFNCLDHKFSRVSELREYLKGIAHYLDSKLTSSNYCNIQFTSQKRKAWKEMLEIVDSIRDNGKTSGNMFQYMFLLLGLALFTDPKENVENLEELQKVYKHMMVNTKEQDNEPSWTEVMIDLILSLLSKESHFYRNVISKVFVNLCPEMTSQNVHQLLQVLNPENENIMSETGKEDDSESSGSEDEEDSEEESSINDDEDDGTDYDKLRAVVRDALGTAAALTDTESIDLDDLDEEEGKRVDESLSEAFREMKRTKLKAKTAEEKELTDFRSRVLDLVEVWFKSEPDINLLLDAMITLIKLLESLIKDGAQIELQNRIRSSITKLTSLKKYKIEGFDKEHFKVLMEQLLIKGERTAAVYINLTPQIIECCTFLLKFSLKDIKHVKKIRKSYLKLYRSTLSDLFTKKNTVTPVGLFDSALSLNWFGAIDLATDISEHISHPDVRSFNQGQGLHLLQLFFNNRRLLSKEVLEENREEIKEILNKLKTIHGSLDEKHLHQFTQLVKVIKKLGIEFSLPELSGETLKGKKRTADDSLVTPKKKIKEDVPEEAESPKKKKKTVNGVVNQNGISEKTVNKKNVKGKQNKYQRAMQLKKKSKMLRVEESSLGLQEGLFQSNVLDFL